MEERLVDFEELELDDVEKAPGMGVSTLQVVDALMSIGGGAGVSSTGTGTGLVVPGNTWIVIAGISLPQSSYDIGGGSIQNPIVRVGATAGRVVSGA